MLSEGCGKKNETEATPEGDGVQVKESGTGEKVDLVLSYSSGNYEMQMGQEIDQRIKVKNGQTQGQTIEQAFTIDLTVSEPDEAGNRTTTMEYTRVTQKMDMGSLAVNYDSASPPGPSASRSERQIAQTMGALLGASIELTMGPDGEPLEVKGLDKVWDDMAAVNPAARQIAQSMKQQLGNDSIKQLWEMQALLLPSESIAPGARWTARQTTAMPVLGEATVSYKCKLTKVAEEDGHRLAHVDFTGDIQSRGGVEGPMPNTEIGAVNLEQKGTYIFDLDLNMITRQQMTQQGTIEMQVQGQEVTSEQTMTQTLTVTPTASD